MTTNREQSTSKGDNPTKRHITFILTASLLFSTADGGTIFLDEVSDTSLSMQAKLLRVLQDGDICMVGSSRPRQVDVRIVAATNKDLRTLVKNRVFREDLFFRLHVLTISMPPLREREDDVLLIASYISPPNSPKSWAGGVTKNRGRGTGDIISKNRLLSALM
ncbi:MAG: sigma 54-interacting transcriptional regulator, partial [Phycisphaerae bacterium]|nr:sigma 54-interacting transcriptional regulator [Phycisphaerae bacterium]